jgi:hypothetical protein
MAKFKILKFPAKCPFPEKSFLVSKSVTFAMANGDIYDGKWENNIATGMHTVTYSDSTTGTVTAQVIQNILAA